MHLAPSPLLYAPVGTGYWQHRANSQEAQITLYSLLFCHLSPVLHASHAVCDIYTYMCASDILPVLALTGTYLIPGVCMCHRHGMNYWKLLHW